MTSPKVEELKFNYKLLGAIIKSKRDKNGLREIAAMINVSPTSLSRIERGIIDNLHIETLVKICNWLDMHPALFFSPPQDGKDGALARLREMRLEQIQDEMKQLEDEIEALS